MNWFEGEIAEAIGKAKTQQSIFVVYVEGKDEKSSHITELINKEEIASKLGSDNFVAIKITDDSVAYQQFSQIYKQVPVPSLYFIGKQGVPLEILTETEDVDTLSQKLETILQKGGYKTVVQQTEDLIAAEQAVAPNVECRDGVCVMKSEASTTEEKVERAKQLMEQKREERQKEELEKEKLKEIERRKMGQNVQQLKRWQDDQELKNLMEEREKEKRESQAARDRVLAQIAQDKAERAAKFSNSPPQVPAPAQASSPRTVNTNTARLQFRMPDGRTATHDFPSSEPLEVVHSYIRTNLNLSFSNYTLSTTFPRREFTEGDKSQSLLDLGLVPTAVILILPINRGGTVSTSSGGGVSGIFWSLLSPIFLILGYLKSFVFGTADGNNKRPAEAGERVQPKVRRAGETTVVRRQGNVHRLSNKNDSDDENNTWNGNSTQQM